MFVETVFWFHPLVWWVGKWIFQEREPYCDEEVLRLGSEPLNPELNDRAPIRLLREGNPTRLDLS
jgi:hypothetical protein